MKLRMTIGRKIQVCVIAMILLSVGLVIGTAFPKFENTMASATKNHLMDQVTAQAQVVENIVKEYCNTFNTLSDGGSVISEKKRYACKEKMTEICQSDEYVEKILLVDEQGKVLAGVNTGDNVPGDMPQDIVMSVLKGEREYGISGVIDAGSGRETVAIAIPVKKDDDEIKGAFVVNISYEVFDKAMKACYVTGIDNLAAYIMDKDGVIFGHTEENKIGTVVKNSVIQNVVERLAGGEVIEREGTSYEYNGVEKFAGYYVIPYSQWIVCMSVNESEIISPIRSVEIRACIISIALCVFACIVTIFMTSFIVKPIRVTNNVLTQIADFSFKLDESYVGYAQKKDETGEMCASICTVVDSLRDEMTQINSVSEELTRTAHSLKKIATSVTKSSENNNGLMKEITESFDGIENAAADIRQYISNVQKSANAMNNKAHDSMEKARSLMERASEIKQKANSADKESEEMFRKVKKTMETALEQAASVEKIGLFTDSIMSIASETKLLSLNASIEAANAGVHGRGFAVVANQIGKLAAQSEESADSIGELVNEIYQAVKGLESCLEQSLAYIEKQVVPDYRQFSMASEGYSRDAGEMIESMNFLKNEINGFLGAMEKSVDAVQQINENIEDSAEKMHGMSEENESVGNQIEETYEMIKDNSALSKRLKKIVEKYIL